MPKTPKDRTEAFWQRVAAYGIDRDEAMAQGRDLAEGLSPEQLAAVRRIVRQPCASKAPPQEREDDG